jgi:hypothetical protein
VCSLKVFVRSRALTAVMRQGCARTRRRGRVMVLSLVQLTTTANAPGVCEHKKSMYPPPHMHVSSSYAPGVCEHKKSMYPPPHMHVSSSNAPGVCEHKKSKYSCRLCGGSDICEHNRRKYTCRDCGGGGICEHNKIRKGCRECKGLPPRQVDKTTGLLTQ